MKQSLFNSNLPCPALQISQSEPDARSIIILLPQLPNIFFRFFQRRKKGNSKIIPHTFCSASLKNQPKESKKYILANSPAGKSPKISRKIRSERLAGASFGKFKKMFMPNHYQPPVGQQFRAADRMWWWLCEKKTPPLPHHHPPLTQKESGGQTLLKRIW